MPYVSIFGYTILALSLGSDHHDFLGWPGMQHSGSQNHLLLSRARVRFYLYRNHTVG